MTTNLPWVAREEKDASDRPTDRALHYLARTQVGCTNNFHEDACLTSQIPEQRSPEQ